MKPKTAPSVITAPAPLSTSTLTSTSPQTWAAYVRVSTETQAKKKDQNGDVHGTHENQVEALTAWAQSAGVRIELYQDPGVTGKDGQNIRGPVFQQMLADLTLKNLCGVAVTATDRLGRSTIEKLIVYQDIRTAGKRVYSLSQGEIDLSDEKALYREMLTVIDTEARTRLVEGMQRGFRRKIAQGWKPGRKPTAINWDITRKLLDAGASVAVCARSFGLTRTQFWRRMQAQGVINPNSRPFGKPKTAEKKEL